MANIKDIVLTKRKFTVDVTNMSDVTESINLLMQQDIPFDMFIGFYNEAEQTFTLTTRGESCYEIIFKGIQQVDDPNIAGFKKLEEKIQKFMVIGNSHILTFKQEPSYGYFAYSAIHSIDNLRVYNDMRQSVNHEMYDKWQLTFNKDNEQEFTKQNVADLLNDTNSITLKLKTILLDQSEIEETVIISKEDFLNNEIISSGALNEQVSGVIVNFTFDYVSADPQTIIGDDVMEIGIMIKSSTQDNPVNLANMQENLSRPTISVMLISNANNKSVQNFSLIPNAKGKVSPYTDKATYPYLASGNYKVNFKLNYILGGDSLTKFYSFLSSQFAGYTIDEYKNALSNAEITLQGTNVEASAPYTTTINCDLSSLVFNSSKDVRTADYEIPVGANLTNIDISYNLKPSVGRSLLADNHHEKAIWAFYNSDIALLIGYIIKKNLKLPPNYKDQFAEYEDFFNANYLILLLYNPVVYNKIVDFAVQLDNESNDNADKPYILVELMKNMDIFSSLFNSSLYDEHNANGPLLTILKDEFNPETAKIKDKGIVSAVQDIIDMAVDHDFNLRSLFKSGIVKNEVLFDAINAEKPYEDEETPGSYRLIDLLFDKSRLSAIDFNFSETDITSIINSLSYIKSFVVDILGLSIKDLASLCSKLMDNLRHFATLDDVKNVASRLGHFDAVFMPTADQLTDYQNTFNSATLSFIEYNIKDKVDNSEITYYNMLNLLVDSKVYDKEGKYIDLLLDAIGGAIIDSLSLRLRMYIAIAPETDTNSFPPKLKVQFYDFNNKLVSDISTDYEVIYTLIDEEAEEGNIFFAKPTEDAKIYSVELKIDLNLATSSDLYKIVVTLTDTFLSSDILSKSIYNAFFYYNIDYTTSDFKYPAGLDHYELINESGCFSGGPQECSNSMYMEAFVPIDTQSMYGDVLFYYDILIYKTLFDNPANSFYIVPYTISDALVYIDDASDQKIPGYIHLTGSDVSAINSDYYRFSGTIVANDYVVQDFFKFSLVGIVDIDSVSGSNLNNNAPWHYQFYMISSKNLVEYSPNIAGNQFYITQKDSNNSVVVKAGTSSVLVHPGKVNIQLSPGSDTLISFADYDSVDYNLSLILIDIGSPQEADMQFDSIIDENYTPPADAPNEVKKDLKITWKHKLGDETKNSSAHRLLRRAGKIYGGSLQSRIEEEVVISSLIIDHYFSKPVANNVSVFFGDYAYNLDIDGQGEKMFLRRIINASDLNQEQYDRQLAHIANKRRTGESLLQDGESEIFIDYNTIVGDDYKVIKPSGNGNDVLYGASDSLYNVFNNGYGDNTFIGSTEVNIFNFDQVGNSYILAFGKRNEIYIPKLPGNHLIQFADNPIASNYISVPLPVTNFVFSGQDLLLYDEILPMNIDVNYSPLTIDDTDDIIQYDSAYFFTLADNYLIKDSHLSLLFNLLIYEHFTANEVPIFSGCLTIPNSDSFIETPDYSKNKIQGVSLFLSKVDADYILKCTVRDQYTDELAEEKVFSINLGALELSKYYFFNFDMNFDADKKITLGVKMYNSEDGTLLKSATWDVATITDIDYNYFTIAPDSLVYIARNRGESLDPSAEYTIYTEQFNVKNVMTTDRILDDADITNIIKVINNIEDIDAEEDINLDYKSYNTLSKPGVRFTSEKAQISVVILAASKMVYTSLIRIAFAGDVYTLAELLVYYKSSEQIYQAKVAAESNIAQPIVELQIMTDVNTSGNNVGQDRILLNDIYEISE